MSHPIVLIVQLFVAAGHQPEFEEFEAAAARIMERHGGRIERRVATRSERGPDQPDEVHVVTFPSESAFEDYRLDPELVPLAALRAQAIRKTVVWQGEDLLLGFAAT